MKEELSKKMEGINIPKIEIKCHKENLRQALLASEYFRPKNNLFRIKRLAPAGAILALMLFFGSSAIYSKIIEAQAMDIARDDSEIKKLNIDFDNAKITIIPALPLPAALATTTPPDQDKRKFVEIETNAAKYIITINLTHKEVENINTELNGRPENEDNDKENNEPDENNDKNNESPESGQNTIATPTPVKNIIPTVRIRTKIDYENETKSKETSNYLTQTEETAEEKKLTPEKSPEIEKTESAATTTKESRNDEKENEKSD